jgi:phenylacetate-coenzyme A ligase PaaK-like adenylate-forming protein
MKPLRMTPLEIWIRGRIGLAPGVPLTPNVVRGYQWLRLQETLEHAARNSLYYQGTLTGRLPVATWSEFTSLPFTTAEDIAADPLEFLCISQAEVARVVTLLSSGTSGPPKRLYFESQDLVRTVDFFRCGMSTMVEEGQRVLILLPGGLPGSVGELLTQGLARMNAEGIVHGPIQEPKDALDDILHHRPECLVGIPVQVLALARHPECRRIPRGSIRSVLLSTDYVPNSIVAELEQVFGCAVFQHYGMTEMGYGGGVECDAHDGYHLREADLFVEVIDPITGNLQPDGAVGEVVFTTLTRNAMPLIRYRTGDLARLIPVACPCGSSLRRLGKVRGRVAGEVRIGSSMSLSMADFDEAIFSIPGVLNFQVEVVAADGCHRLCTTVYCDPGRFVEIIGRVQAELNRMPTVRLAVDREILRIEPVHLSPESWFTTGSAKRMLIAGRKERTSA